MRTHTIRSGGVLLALAMFGLAGCSTAVPSSLHFAQVGGDAVVSEDGAASVNLVFAAASQDPIWSGIHEVVVNNDAAEGGDLVLAGAAVQLLPGSETDGTRVGTIAIDMPAETERFDLTSIAITARAGDEPVTYDVGNWRFERQASAGGVSVTGEYPASVPQCEALSFSVRSDDGSAPNVSGVTTAARSVEVIGFAVDEGADGVQTIEVDLRCDDRYDLHTFTPVVAFDTGTEEQHLVLQPILIGYLDLTADEVAQILTR